MHIRSSHQVINKMKRAQIHVPFIILSAAAIILTILLFGTHFYTQMLTVGCQAEIASFKADLESTMNTQALTTGNEVHESIRVPCGIEKVVIFDEEKGTLFAGFEDEPEILYNKLEEIFSDADSDPLLF